MTFSRTTLFVSVVTLATLAVCHDAEACRRSGGRSYGGYSRGYSSRSYGYYQTPRYHTGYPQSPVGQPVGPPPVAPQQQFAPQQAGVPQQQQFAPQQAGTPQQQQFAPQQAGTPQQQQFAPQQAGTPQQQQFAPQQTGTPQQTAPATPQQNNAQISALQALGGFAPPQTAPAQTQTQTHVGSWSATLGNGGSVRLTLESNGNFTWVATNSNGTASSFSGSYSFGNGALTLIRGNDNQQLNGSVTNSGTNAFSFKVAGRNAAAIDFKRS